MSNLTASLLEDFRYNSETGELRWRTGKRASYLAGCIDADGYLVVTWNKKRKKLSHLIWAIHNNEWPDNIDHIDRNKLNNRINNLRLGNSSLQIQNRDYTDNPDSCIEEIVGVRGVKYRAKVMVNKVRTHLGNFNSREEARAAVINHRNSLCTPP